MSASIVSEAHIDLLVTAGLLFGPSGTNGITWNESASANGVDYRGRTLTRATADNVGSMLWAENLASVAYRYPNDKSGERPGPVGFDDMHVHMYRFEKINGNIPPIAVLSAIDEYEYQSCEHSSWNASEAKRYCDVLRSNVVTHLPGYDKYVSFDDRDQFMTGV